MKLDVAMMDSFDPNTIIGPVEVGLVIAAFLCGCVFLQAYIYYSKFDDDPMIFRVLTALLTALTLAHLMCICAALWNMTITTYGQPEKLEIFPYGADMTLVFSALLAFSVRLFFISRVWKLDNAKVVPVCCFLMSCYSVVITITIAGKAFVMTSALDYVATQGWMITSALAVGATCDMTITLSISWNLRQRGKTGFMSTSRLIDQVVRWTVETGLIIALQEIATLACFVTMRDNYIWMGLYAVEASVYGNSVLAVLNHRPSTRKKARNAVYEMEGHGNLPKMRNTIVINVTESIERETESDSSKDDSRQDGLIDRSRSLV
ncbi:hypothetical protein BV22DRAFT_1133344 [Leucogyrophana mollusca]|uniref:Uncharacterized protein n=1 Tax=Leucogyrophana mollusca TaxID=85980 RepID=A0ACB8B5G3_9AGAM|nr:hypothetical protein BV22DRAFT_1133344 [Leucogyrophana mollusca]